MESPVEALASKRAVVIGRVVLVWAVLVVGRLVWLQVARHEDYARAARSQHKHMVEIPALRGEVLARDGKPLAISIATETAVVSPMRVADAGFFASVVAPALGLDERELREKLIERQGSGVKRAGRGFLVVKRHLSEEERDRLGYLRRTFPIEIIRDARREYPNGATGAHVVGSIDGEGNGNAGIEQKLNAELRGKPGKMMVLTGSRQDSYLSWVSEEGVQGVNVQLSIDRVLQHEAERALEEGVKAAGAEGGTVVAMNPENGEVYALANYPNFDPRETKPDAAGAAARHTNTAVQIPCEPGSVMKMITVTMGLDIKKFRETDVIYCENGAFARPKRGAIHDTHRYGGLDVAGVLIKSSNIGVAKISIASGPEALYAYLKKFGIGDRTGIELPAESRGSLARQNCAERTSARERCWTPASHEYIAFGHEVSATAVQLARAVAVIANGGMLVEPHLVTRKSRPRAFEADETLPLADHTPRRALDGEVAVRVRRIMERVVLEGTGKPAALAGYSAGGKTGSAEIFENGGWQNKHNSSFVGFAPVANPKVVVVVTLNRTPRLGSVAAGPVFKRVTETALRVLQVPKDRPETDRAAPAAEKEESEVEESRTAKVEVKAAPKVEKEEAPTPTPLLAGPKTPDFRGKPMVAVLREAAALGVEVETLGHGKAKEQAPAPGTVLALGERIRVRFSVAP